MAIRTIGCVLALCALLAPTTFAQKRRLGPADRTRILDARLDPSFQSSGLKRLAFLPFSNELDYQEGALVLGETFLGQMRQRHDEVTVLAPADVLQIVKQNGLSDGYRTFIGNYINTDVTTTAFLEQLGAAAGVDGIIVGRIVAYSVLTETRNLNTGLGIITLRRNKAVVGMQLRIFRASDGRELWSGLHAVEGQQNQTVIDLAKVVGDVFAQYYGRLPY